MSGNNPGFPGVAHSSTDQKEQLKRIARSMNAMLQGKLNAVATVTLTANASTTTLTDNRITNNSFIWFMPTTANAAAALSSLYITGRIAANGTTKGTATINHANDANSDKTFTVLIIG